MAIILGQDLQYPQLIIPIMHRSTNRWWIVLIPALLLLQLTTTQQSTLLSFLIQVKEESRKDFLELTVATSASSEGLGEAIRKALQRAQKIKETAIDLCRSIYKSKEDCKQSAQIGNVKIEPKYQVNKREKVYAGITASYDILIKVAQPKNLGKLVDSILVLEGIVIEKIEWQPDESKIENRFIEEGIARAEELCGQLSRNYGRLVSVEQVREQPQEQQQQVPQGKQQQEQQEQEQEQQPEEKQNVKVYVLSVECVGKRAPKKEGKKTK